MLTSFVTIGKVTSSKIENVFGSPKYKCAVESNKLEPREYDYFGHPTFILVFLIRMQLLEQHYIFHSDEIR